MPLFELSNALDEKRGNKQSVAIGLGNIAYMAQIFLGGLAVAERNLRHSIDLCREIQDERYQAISHQELGRLLALRSSFNEAESELTTAQDVFDKEGGNNFVSVVRAYRALRALLTGDTRAALATAQQARELADEIARTYRPFERDFIRAEWLWGAALVMEGNDLNAAATHLTDALTRCRRINMVDHEPDILLAWARWHRARGNAQEAQAYAEEALAIADRCEYRLKQAEIHNFLARWWMDRAESSKQEAEGSKSPSVAEALAEAKQHAEIAKERAWCDGPPHCYKPALDEAERMLASL